MKAYGSNYLDSLSEGEIEEVADRYFEDLAFEKRVRKERRKDNPDMEKLEVERYKTIKKRLFEDVENF